MLQKIIDKVNSNRVRKFKAMSNFDIDKGVNTLIDSDILFLYNHKLRKNYSATSLLEKFVNGKLNIITNSDLKSLDNEDLFYLKKLSEDISENNKIDFVYKKKYYSDVRYKDVSLLVSKDFSNYELILSIDSPSNKYHGVVDSVAKEVFKETVEVAESVSRKLKGDKKDDKDKLITVDKDKNETAKLPDGGSYEYKARENKSFIKIDKLKFSKSGTVREVNLKEIKEFLSKTTDEKEISKFIKSKGFDELEDKKESNTVSHGNFKKFL